MMLSRRSLTVLTLAGMAGCGTEPPAATPALPVTITLAGTAGEAREHRYGGAIEADASVDLSFRVSGLVDAVAQVRGADGRMRNIQDGDPVRRGTVLARLRQDEYRDQLADAAAGARQAQADYERASQLYESRSVSKADYDAAYARYTAGRARENQAAIALSDATLRAPIDGVIIRRNAEAGSLAGPAIPAFTVADTRRVKVVFGVPDVVVAGLHPGDALTVEAEALPGELLTSRITRISPSADPNSRVFEVEASLPNPGDRLKIGMLATLRLGDAAPEQVPHVPLAAVIRPPADSAGYALWIIREEEDLDVAELRRVTLGDVSGNLIAIRTGLSGGERIIVRGATLVTAGQAVRIVP